jgi:hypothetical protein
MDKLNPADIASVLSKLSIREVKIINQILDAMKSEIAVAHYALHKDLLNAELSTTLHSSIKEKTL